MGRLHAAASGRRFTPSSPGHSGWKAGVGAAVVIAVIILLGFFVFQETGRMMLDDNSLFEIRDIQIENTGKMEPDLICKYAKVKLGENLFKLDLKQIRRDLEEVPLIQSVQVTRRLPGTLVIHVNERTAIARLPALGGSMYHAVDADGFVMGPTAATAMLPTIQGYGNPAVIPGRQLEGPDIRDALGVIEICDRTRLGLSMGLNSVDVTSPDSLLLSLNHDDRAWIPRKSVEAKIRLLAATLKAIELEGRRGPGPVTLDLRSDKVVVGTGLRTH